MHFLNRVEFYITNVCNLNCTNCNRFNNFAFSGHWKWNDYLADYKAWSKVIDLGQVAILGGEPMSNPDLPNWINGVNQLWPNLKKISLVTNGTYLNKIPGFYDFLTQFNDRVRVEISGHNAPEIINDIDNIIEFFPTAPTQTINYNQSLWQTRYASARQWEPKWPDCPDPADFYQLPESIQKDCLEKYIIHPLQLFDSSYTDGTVTVEFFPILYFYPSPVQHNLETGQLTLHHSDPVLAMENCYFKTCPHFIKGRLYKCGPAGILPEFIKQFEINITESDRTLINSYEPAQHTWEYDRLEKFLNNQKNADPIAQCKFCPSKLTTEPLPLRAGYKKIKLAKNISI